MTKRGARRSVCDRRSPPERLRRRRHGQWGAWSPAPEAHWRRHPRLLQYGLLAGQFSSGMQKYASRRMGAWLTLRLRPPLPSYTSSIAAALIVPTCAVSPAVLASSATQWGHYLCLKPPLSSHSSSTLSFALFPLLRGTGRSSTLRPRDVHCGDQPRLRITACALERPTSSLACPTSKINTRCKNLAD